MKVVFLYVAGKRFSCADQMRSNRYRNFLDSIFERVVVKFYVIASVVWV